MVRKIVSYSLRLLLICGVAGLGVSQTYNFVKAKIDANAEAAFDAALKEVSGGTAVEEVETPENWSYWKGEGDLYITEGGAQGYSSRLRVLVAVVLINPEDPELKAIKVLFQQETPGLGVDFDEKAAEGRAVEKPEFPPFLRRPDGSFTNF